MEILSLKLREDDHVPVHVFIPSAAHKKGAVIFYMDAFGLRPELDEMAQRYADAGYVTFLPDLYHRLDRCQFRITATADEPPDSAMNVANSATTLAMSIADTAAILDHVAATPAYGVGRFGTVGYCMGARHALAAAAAYRDKIAASALLHGGRLVWDGPDSPHLLIPRVSAALYFGFAANDETCPDEHKRLIEQTIAASSTRARTEQFLAGHGWTFPTRWCYDAAAAEHAFETVVNLFDAEVAPQSESTLFE
jgi:carboxymethylenebutenolidase